MKPKKKDPTLYIIFGLFLYVIICLIGCHVGIVMSENPENNLFTSLMEGFVRFREHPFDIFPFTLQTFKAIGLVTVAFALIILWVYIDGQKHANTMPGKESGSAGWNTDLKKYNKTFSDPKGSSENNGPYNMLLTKDVALNLNTYVTRRNNNVVVVGGSGSGKSRFFVKPNILQANTNYVITDPAGDLLQSTGEFLKRQGYEIKVFNLVEMTKSDCYNPFNYIRDDLGVLMMINCLIKNTNPAGQSTSDPFWEKSETALLQALCFYLIKYRPKHEQNFTSVMKLLRAAEINEQNPNAKSKLDKIFDEVEKNDPNSIALKQYQTFKMGAGRTLKSILISCSVRLTVFNLRQIEGLTGRDTIDLGSMGEGKKALFVIIPAADSTYNFLVSMMYSQLFETLYYVAETQTKDKKLSTHVRFLLDEFANIGQIPEFTQKLSTMRKYEISCNVILQNLAQLKTMYKDDWETIIGNCDTFLFLGGQEYSTLEYISKELGDQTIVVRNNSRSRGKSSSSSLTYNRSGRKLMFPDEIGRMDEKCCILIIRGLKPFFGEKYDYPKHPNYKYTGDADDNLKYINIINNLQPESVDELEVKYLEKKGLAYTRASLNSRPEARIVGDAAPISDIATTLNITKAEQIFSRFVVLPPEDELTTLNNLSAEKEESVNNVNDDDEKTEMMKLENTVAESREDNTVSDDSKEEDSPLIPDDDQINGKMNAQSDNSTVIDTKRIENAAFGIPVINNNGDCEEWNF